VALLAAQAAVRPFRTVQGNLLLHEGRLNVSKIWAGIKLIVKGLGVIKLML